jgi:LysR family cyn operon transcriptional activator
VTECVEIRHLRYFLAVAETENFTRAAGRLGVSQPTISQQITQLERELRTPLFQRVGKRVFLTEAGATFRKGAEDVLRKLDEACRAVNSIAELVSGSVTLGVIPALHFGWVPPVLVSMARTHPGVTIGVQELASSQIETEVEAGRLDLGFGLVTHHSPNIRYERLLSQPFSLIVSSNSRLAALESVSLGQLEGERFALLPESFNMRRTVNTMFADAGVRLRIMFELDSISSILSSVSEIGLATLLPAIVLEGRGIREITAVRLAHRAPRLDFGILWPAASEAAPAALAVANSLQETISLRQS